ncbi:hypothetical protein [Candidatus Spongiihabitans sp.]|uniref:hypothetical protein n=1 Tax=Candidatus Spongiihabitans sp. TaxID=3101308 RepID=UPI003C7DE9C0
MKNWGELDSDTPAVILAGRRLSRCGVATGGGFAADDESSYAGLFRSFTLASQRAFVFSIH